ncbi:hypothetical protein chiPu_0028051 [Chiloscyllium punctatum]|uniref:Uncharacterized protein n=1 Tax=Chiloscyllium punctatum TaxID=137246 RepID=A0A401TNC4_CHIPU|nr:hypothetical protein [Chiloscyllium punctatum]
MPKSKRNGQGVPKGTAGDARGSRDTLEELLAIHDTPGDTSCPASGDAVSQSPLNYRMANVSEGNEMVTAAFHRPLSVPG